MSKPGLCALVVVVLWLCGVLCQLEGSGTNGTLRLCVVEARGGYRLAPKFCPVLEKEGAGVECVVAGDRLDCLRRMSKGAVDFGVFDPEDLVATQWAEVDLLVTNQLKDTSQMFAAEIACIVSRGWLLRSPSEGGPDVVLRNSTLCHPGHGGGALSDALADYLESLVTERSCNPALTLAENRLLSVANYFNAACKPGPWLGDELRDAQLKRLHPKLCQACRGGACTKDSGYWGRQGSLNCLTDGAGDVTWASLDDVRHRFGLNGERQALDDPHGYAYLCRDGTTQALADNPRPCVWLNVPWPVVVAKRKSAEAVSRLQEQLTGPAALVGGGWRAALLALLEARSPLPPPPRPQRAPQDYLGEARGFREAYSRAGCSPSRHITLCTASPSEQSKCEWMSEAGGVYGAEPPLQCALRATRALCVAAVAEGNADAVVAGADWLVTAQRDHDLIPILFETNPIVRTMNVVVAHARSDSQISGTAGLRGRSAAFPRHDGVAWHSVARYLHSSELSRGCDSDTIISNFFGESCAPRITNSTLPDEAKRRLTARCAAEGLAVEGEEEALRLVAEGRADVAFVGMDALDKYTGINATQPWAAKLSGADFKTICPDTDHTYCFYSWSSPAQVYVSKHLTPMRRQEILNAFQRLDQLFGKTYPFHKAAFTMYGPFNHNSDILFHDNMRSLSIAGVLSSTPFRSWPRNFETSMSLKAMERCASGGRANVLSGVTLGLCLVFYFVRSVITLY